MAKRYEIQQYGGKDDGASIIGPVSEHNVYITAYPAVEKGHKPIEDLEVGESTVARYSLSGSSGLYRIARIEDGPAGESDALKEAK